MSREQHEDKQGLQRCGGCTSLVPHPRAISSSKRKLRQQLVFDVISRLRCAWLAARPPSIVGLITLFLMMLWGVLASFPLLWSATASPGSEAFERLKQEAHLLGSTDVKARLEDVRLLLGAERQQEQQEKKIEHFVVLLLENHAADNTFGCMDLPGFDGIPPGGRQIPKDPSDPSKGVINVSCGSASYVCKNGPGYDTWAGKFAPGAQPYTYPYGEQDDKYSALHGADGVAVQMFSGQLLPVKRAFAQHFGVFNKLFCGVPSASTPNHFMVQSATSCGLRWNVMYNDTLCGGHKLSGPVVCATVRLSQRYPHIPRYGVLGVSM